MEPAHVQRFAFRTALAAKRRFRLRTELYAGLYCVNHVFQLLTGCSAEYSKIAHLVSHRADDVIDHFVHLHADYQFLAFNIMS